VRCEQSAALVSSTNHPITATFVNPCASNPCYAGSTCLYSMGPNPTFICYCAPGLTGSLCNVLISNSLATNFAPTIPTTTTTTTTTTPNPCLSPYTCVNGGTCVAINQTSVQPPYACLCPPAYTGFRCDIPVVITTTTTTTTTTATPTTTTTTVKYNPCFSGPCQYGTCLPISNTGGFVCVCYPSYTGLYCQNQMTTSTTTRCHFCR
jgi:hypothetical protein